jgi:hypothetical protein
MLLKLKRPWKHWWLQVSILPHSGNKNIPINKEPRSITARGFLLSELKRKLYKKCKQEV